MLVRNKSLTFTKKKWCGKTRSNEDRNKVEVLELVGRGKDSDPDKKKKKMLWHFINRWCVVVSNHTRRYLFCCCCPFNICTIHLDFVRMNSPFLYFYILPFDKWKMSITFWFGWKRWVGFSTVSHSRTRLDACARFFVLFYSSRLFFLLQTRQLIFSGEYTKAMSKDWHLGHFSCWQCDESLTGQRYVLRDEHPYCVKCYETVFANNCDDCNRVIGIDSKVSCSFSR